MGKTFRYLSGGGLRVGILATVLVVVLSGSVGAQDRELEALRQRIEELEGNIRSITRYLSNTPDAPRGSFDAAEESPVTGSRADLEVRMTALETVLRDLTGQMEESLHRIDQLNRRLDQLAQDYEFRFQQLEQGTAPATGSARQGLPAAPTPAPDAAPPQTAAGEPEPLPTGEPVALYDRALGLLRQEDYTSAADAFQLFLAQYPEHQLAANAQYWLGESHYARTDYAEAARAFLKAYETYPDSSKASGALLKLGISLGELGQTLDACAALREFDRRFSDASPIEANRATQARGKLNCP